MVMNLNPKSTLLSFAHALLQDNGEETQGQRTLRVGCSLLWIGLELVLCVGRHLLAFEGSGLEGPREVELGVPTDLPVTRVSGKHVALCQ
jgi:hypothetical protein